MPGIRWGKGLVPDKDFDSGSSVLVCLWGEPALAVFGLFGEDFGDLEAVFGDGCRFFLGDFEDVFEIDAVVDDLVVVEKNPFA